MAELIAWGVVIVLLLAGMAAPYLAERDIDRAAAWAFIGMPLFALGFFGALGVSAWFHGALGLLLAFVVLAVVVGVYLRLQGW